MFKNFFLIPDRELPLLNKSQSKTKYRINDSRKNNCGFFCPQMTLQDVPKMFQIDWFNKHFLEKVNQLSPHLPNGDFFWDPPPY